MRFSVSIFALLATTFCYPLVGFLSLNPSLSIAATPTQSADEMRKAEADRLFKQGKQQLDATHFDEALQSFQSALKLYQEIGNRVDEAMALTSLGEVYSYFGKYPQALSYHHQALNLTRDDNVRSMFPHKSRLIEALALGNIGSVYLLKGTYLHALQAYQQALSIAKALGEIRQEVLMLSRMGLAYTLSGQDAKALEHYQRSLNIFRIARRLSNEQRQERTFSKIEHIYHNQGQGFLRSEPLDQESENYTEIDILKDESVIFARIGNLYFHQKRYVQAIDSFQQVLAIHRKIGDRVGEYTALNNIGEIYRFRGQNTQALKNFQQALEIVRQVGDRGDEVTTRNRIGLIHLSLGQYAQALESFQPSLKIARELDDQWAETSILNNIGLTYLLLGQHQQALEFLQQGLKIDKKYGHISNETVLNNIGQVYLTQKQDAQALQLFQESLNIARKFSYIDNGESESRSLSFLGQVYLKQKHYSQALQFYQQALGIVKAIGKRSAEGTILNGIGKTYHAQKQYTQALKFYQQSLSISKQSGDRRNEARVLNDIGDLLYEQRKPELAIVFYKQSVNTWESIRGELRKLSIEQQQSFTNSVADNYRQLANLLLKQNRVLEAQRVLDLLKVQELEDYLRDVRGNAQTAQGVEFWQPEQRILDLYNRAIAQGNELAQLRAFSDAKLTPKQRQRLEQLVAAEGEILQSFDAFTNRPEVAAAVQQLSQTTKNQNVELSQLNSLQNNLRQMKQNAVLLYPLILDDRLELVLVTPNSPPIRRPVNVRREDLNRAITEFLQALKDPTSDATKPAQKLYQWLIQPIEADLTAAKAQTIVYAPDGQLRYAPLAALHDGKQWLTQRFRVNYITAASLTDFDDPPQTQMKVLAAAFSDASRQFTVKAGDRSLTFAGLPYAKTEVENLAATVPGTTELLNSAFNRKSTLPRLGSYTVVHMATHAAFLPGQPEESFILFGDGDRLSLRDLKQLNLPNVDLVVLSACETGVGNQLGNGIEILGFGFQMQRTGARAAIASLWQVNDGGTQVLMNDFYTILQQGKISKAEALRQAQIAMITQTHPTVLKGQTIAPGLSNRLTHPYYWAPFILIGNGL